MLLLTENLLPLDSYNYVGSVLLTDPPQLSALTRKATKNGCPLIDASKSRKI